MKFLSIIFAFTLLVSCKSTKILSVDEHMLHIQQESKLAKDGSFFKKLSGETKILFQSGDDYVDTYGLGFMPKYFFASADESKKTIDLGIITNTKEWRFWDRAADTTHSTKFDFYEGSRETHSSSYPQVCWEQFILTMSTEDAIRVANSYADGDHGPWWITIAGRDWSETKVGISVNYLKAFLIKLGKYDKGTSPVNVVSD